MTFNRTITIISVAVAVIASAAATVQSYVSWKGRNEFLTSAALGQVVKGCHDVAFNARSIVLGNKDTTGGRIRNLHASVAALDIVVDALYPEEHFQMQNEVMEFESETLQVPLDADDNVMRGIQIRFLVNLGLKCTNIIRRQIQG